MTPTPADRARAEQVLYAPCAEAHSRDDCLLERIAQALAAQKERDAQIADEYAEKMETAATRRAPKNLVATCKADAGRSIAAAIRQEATP